VFSFRLRLTVSPLGWTGVCAMSSPPSLEAAHDGDGHAGDGVVRPRDLAGDGVLEVAVAEVDDRDLARGDGHDEVGGADGRVGRDLAGYGHVDGAGAAVVDEELLAGRVRDVVARDVRRGEGDALALRPGLRGQVCHAGVTSRGGT